MNVAIPRMRVFAGANASGKSTIKGIMPPEWLGIYVNADDLEGIIRRTGELPLDDYRITPSTHALHQSLQRSTLLVRQELTDEISGLEIVDGRLVFGAGSINSYWASAIGEFLRQELLAARLSFSFETVMSHRSKVEFIQQARNQGYKTYLYYITTEDPEINVSRVRGRVIDGGHDVPDHKVRERYFKSLELLVDALLCSDRSYFFDNSSDGNPATMHFAESEYDGQDTRKLTFHTHQVPVWFVEYVLNRIS